MSVYLSNQPDPAAVKEAMGRERCHLVRLLELQFASGTMRISNENVPLIDGQWGETWQGYGGLVSASSVSGGSGSLAPMMDYSLGIPYEVMTEDERYAQGAGLMPRLIGNPSEYRNRKAILREQYVDDDNRDEHGRPTAIGYPVAIHSGLMDMPRASFSLNGAVLTMSVEGVLIRAGAPVFGHYTHRDQQRRYSGDKGLRYVPEVVDTSPTWTDW